MVGARVCAQGAAILARRRAIQRVARGAYSGMGLSVCQLLLRVGVAGDRHHVCSACSRLLLRAAGAQLARVRAQCQVHRLGQVGRYEPGAT